MADEKPQVYSATGVDTEFKNSSRGSYLKNNLGKILFGLFIVILVVEVGYFYKNWNTSVSAVQKIQALTDPSLALVSTKTSYKVGDTIPVMLKLGTGGHMIDSIDAVIKYDPAAIEASSSAITTTTLYDDYPVVSVDADKGLITLSGTIKPGSNGIVGVGDVATINLKAKKEGAVELALDFQKGSTTDSNTTEPNNQYDTLGMVYNLNLDITKVEASVKPMHNGLCSGYYQYCNNSVGQTGKQYCSGGSTIKTNSCSYDANQTTTCGPCEIGR